LQVAVAEAVVLLGAVVLVDTELMFLDNHLGVVLLLKELLNYQQVHTQSQ
jgi:hypothetical protein